jgi:hypothetical protein
MQTQDSLPCSQEIATVPHPEPQESSPYTLPPYFFSIRCNFILLFVPTIQEVFSL